ncbi:MAG: penicillin-binding protein 1A [Alphaproteobacteria bacterium]|nr:penicillin-binding protein 1A [Alphaproteobacteria bacterium]
MLRAIRFLLSILLLFTVLGVGGVLYMLYHFGRGLPAYKQLADYDPPTVTRVHAGDGRLISEYAVEKRVFVPTTAMQKRVINAFLSAEDKNFYTHPGIDLLSVVRAMVTNLANMGTEQRLEGGSTITQQVAKNFLLSNEVSVERKIKEAILAFRIERAFSKDRILELYLNEIYLGLGSYGVAAAALNYFNKSLGELSIAEMAYLAALPKAPNNYHPLHYPEAALARRNWVIDRILEDGHITSGEALEAKAMPLQMRRREDTQLAKAEYFLEEVRRWIFERYGYQGLYEGGLSVRTSLDPYLQGIADTVLREGLRTYDRRHGWRGPFTRINPGADWARQVAAVLPPGLLDWKHAVVLAVSDESVDIGFPDGAIGTIPLAELTWARQALKDGKLGPRVRRAGDVLAVGDVIAVENVTSSAPKSKDEAPVFYLPNTYALRQIPEVNGGIIALDPHTGRVLAMSGGYDFSTSEFNRVTQAKRQPGSAFKPFVYLAALAQGFTPSTLVLDAPFVIDQGQGLGKWKPANYTEKFYGPIPMRTGIEKSRNLVTVRLAQTIGMDKVMDYAQRFGVMDDMPPQLAMALGAGETTLLDLTTAYAQLVNGGKRIAPNFIDRIQDRNGRTIYRHDNRPCESCVTTFWSADLEVPGLPDNREQVVNPASAYQVVSMLQGVVDRGTGRRIKEVGKPLAGKTGTTNESFDTWFVGFSPDLAVGIWVGFDQPKTMGNSETGSSVTAPIFRDFMDMALEDKPGIPFRVPPGIRLVRVNAATGLPAVPGDKRVILEAFKPGTEPSLREGVGLVIDGNALNAVADSPVAGPGG